MRYDIYRRENSIMVIESAKPPANIDLMKWTRLHISATHYVLAGKAKTVALIDEEIKATGMSTFPLKEGARGL
nr:hypothetical protein [uncultured Dongia sp.]